ncbi:MAG: DUF2723 domain-containing protein [Acidimicrobiales bacterium]
MKVSLGFAFVAFVAYQAVRTRYPVEWDGAQLVMGLDRFDVTRDTPHSPGYWLYLLAGRTVRAATPLDGTASLTLVSSLAAAAAVGLTHSLGRTMGGRLLGVLAASLMLTSPFLWFYGSSVGTYSLDALACAVLLSLAWHARPGSAHGVAAAVALGLAAGFRLTSLLLFAPLAVIAMARSARSLRVWVQGAAAGAGAIVIWFVPMLIEQPGGLRAWRSASDALLGGSVEQTSILSGAAEVVTRNITQGAAYALTAFLPAIVAALVIAGRRLSERRRGEAVTARPALDAGDETSPDGEPRPWWTGGPVLAATGALPALAFLLFIHFGKAGYLLAVLPAGVLLLLLPVRSLQMRSRRVVAVVVALVCLVSVQRFLMAPGLVPATLVDAAPLFITSSVNGAPYPFTRQAMAASDRLTREQAGLRDRFDPSTDVLVWGWLNGGERYRHGMLTLPEFTASFVRDSVHLHTARAYRWETGHDAELEVPPGGRAVFVLDHVPPDLEALLDAGLASPVHLSTGATVWVVEPGVTLLGVEVVEGETSVDADGAR